MLNPHEEKCVYKKFYSKISDYTKYLDTFGVMGVVCSIIIVKSKLEYQVMMFMLLGYAQNFIGITYRMINLPTKHIVLSSDVIWMNKNYDRYISSQ